MEITQPTRFEWLHELNKRIDLGKFTNLRDEYLNLEKGVRGEKDFEKFLFENGNPHWVVLKNVWLDCKGKFECDFLVFTKAKGYLFEIKNYSGKYEYRENQWFRYGSPNSHNPLSQVQKATTNVQNIFKNLRNSPKIQGVLVFIGEFNQVHLYENTHNIQVVQRNELMDLFWEMKQEERNYMGYSPDKKELLKELARYETVNPYQNQPVSEEVLQLIRRGICCSRCSNFDLEKKDGFYICSCGIYEPKDHAILRTICEYGILHPNQNFKTSELLTFFDGEVSQRSLIRILNKYFQRVGGGRSTEYMNKLIRPENIKSMFQLKGDLFLKLP